MSPYEQGWSDAVEVLRQVAAAEQVNAFRERLELLAVFMDEKAKHRQGTVRLNVLLEKARALLAQDDPTALECFLVDFKSAPRDLQERAARLQNEGSVGIGRGPKGWFILLTQGAGPALAWAEWQGVPA